MLCRMNAEFAQRTEGERAVTCQMEEAERRFEVDLHGSPGWWSVALRVRWFLEWSRRSRGRSAAGTHDDDDRMQLATVSLRAGSE